MPTWIVTERHPDLPPPEAGAIALTLPLTAEERTRSRYRWIIDSRLEVVFKLPRGTVLQGGEALLTHSGEWVQILAKPEPVLTVTAPDTHQLLRAAYHLGNRHVPLEITPDYLRLSVDPVLEQLLTHMGLTIQAAIAPFCPEPGAYAHTH